LPLNRRRSQPGPGSGSGGSIGLRALAPRSKGDRVVEISLAVGLGRRRTRRAF
jgi:hypothetical protein